jgi:tetratricopeptide (TPR) repeat protein
VDNAGPVLPDAAAASETIKAWAASQPRFAELLGTGVPVVRALTRWGFEFLAANQSSEAVAAFGSALALIPGDHVLWANYGMALKQADSTSEAAACLERSVALLRFQPETWLMLGWSEENWAIWPARRRHIGSRWNRNRSRASPGN